jgi:hypothetical protein
MVAYTETPSLWCGRGASPVSLTAAARTVLLGQHASRLHDEHVAEHAARKSPCHGLCTQAVLGSTGSVQIAHRVQNDSEVICRPASLAMLQSAVASP